MDYSELALVAFSILAQLSVGSFFVLSLISWVSSRKTGKHGVDLFAGAGLWAILGVMGLALISSLLHLGNVRNAYLSILNIESAWLSREIVSALAFTFFLALFVFLKWRKSGSTALHNSIGVFAAVSGLVLVFCMSMIYTYIRTQPAWNTPFTIGFFFVTTLLLGSLGSGVIIMATKNTTKVLDARESDGKDSLLHKSIRGISIATIILLGVEMVLLPIYLTNLAISGHSGASTAAMIMQPFGLAMALRLILAFLGAGVLMAVVYKFAANQGQEKVLSNLVFVAFALVLIAETIGRFLFYVTNVRVGI